MVSGIRFIAWTIDLIRFGCLPHRLREPRGRSDGGPCIRGLRAKYRIAVQKEAQVYRFVSVPAGQLSEWGLSAIEVSARAAAERPLPARGRHRQPANEGPVSDPKATFDDAALTGSSCPIPAIPRRQPGCPRRVESCLRPAYPEVALLSHSPCSPSEREAGHEATRFHNFSRRYGGCVAACRARAASRRCR
jgi:hypothetical protein